MLALMFAGAVAELAAVGSVVPFLSLLAGDQGPGHFAWIREAFASLGATTPDAQLAMATGLFVVAAILAGALRLQLAWSTQRFTLGLGHEIAVEIHRRTLLQPYSYHLGQNSSEIVASLDKVQLLTSGVLLQLMQAASAAFIAIFIIAALVQIDVFTAAVAALAFGAIYALVSLVARKRLSANSAIVGSAYGQRVKIIQESLGGIRDIILDGSQAGYLDEFRRVDRRFATAAATTAFIATAPRFVIEAVGMVLIAGLALLLADRAGGIAGALPILGALALGAQRLLPLFQQIYTAWSRVAGNRSIIGQVIALMRLPVDETESPSSGPLLPFDDCIRFERLSFSYPGRSAAAVHDISFAIPHGARVALVGRTGSGKSTLADLLMGLLEPSDGQILIDGRPLNAANRRSWQRGIAHVPQAIFLADASIARNIAFGVAESAIAMDRVREAAAIAQLDEFIDSLDDGYATSVGERGVRLSGGQRQRLGIARAVYKQAPVLVLDEATSALDDSTEAAVLRALDALSAQGRTIVIIAHRLTTVENCDLVVRLERGRATQIGSYAEVVGKAREAG